MQKRRTQGGYGRNTARETETRLPLPGRKTPPVRASALDGPARTGKELDHYENWFLGTCRGRDRGVRVHRPGSAACLRKKLGKMLRELKKYTGAASEEIQKNVVEPLNEIQAPLKEAVAPLTDIKKDIDNSVKDVTKSFTGIGKTSKEEAEKKAAEAEEVVDLTEEPVEELAEDAPTEKAEPVIPPEQQPKAQPAEAPAEEAAPAEAAEAAPAQPAAEAAPAAEQPEEDPRQNDILPQD